MGATFEPRHHRRDLPPRPWVILLVDDEPDVLASMARLLEDSLRGVRVLSATSGRAGMAVLETERVDAVVSDFKMVGMDGIEFLYLARKLRPGVPRAMVTAFASPELVQRATIEGGVHGFISKAANPDEFIDQVAGLLAYEPAIVPGP